MFFAVFFLRQEEQQRVPVEWLIIWNDPVFRFVERLASVTFGPVSGDTAVQFPFFVSRRYKVGDNIADQRKRGDLTRIDHRQFFRCQFGNVLLGFGPETHAALFQIFVNRMAVAASVGRSSAQPDLSVFADDRQSVVPQCGVCHEFGTHQETGILHRDQTEIFSGDPVQIFNQFICCPFFYRGGFIRYGHSLLIQGEQRRCKAKRKQTEDTFFCETHIVPFLLCEIRFINTDIPHNRHSCRT